MFQVTFTFCCLQRKVSLTNIEVFSTDTAGNILFDQLFSASFISSSCIYFDPSSVLLLPIRCAVTPHLCDVTPHPVGYSTQVRPVDGELWHMDGEIQHTGASSGRGVIQGDSRRLCFIISLWEILKSQNIRIFYHFCWPYIWTF
jgi:hypothetical protein